MGRGRVAGDHQQLNAALDQQARRLDRVAGDRLGAFGAIRQAGGVAEIQQRFGRQAVAQRTQNGQAADTAVEDADRPVMKAHVMDAHEGRGCRQPDAGLVNGKLIRVRR
jgi:hypothetical protein